MLVAKEQDLLLDLQSLLHSTFPRLKFRVIVTDLSIRDNNQYLKDIIEQTSDLDISLLFNIAGYLLMEVCMSESLVLGLTFMIEFCYM